MPGATPRVRIESACRILGREEVIRRCAAVLDGWEPDPEFLVTIGGAPAMRLLVDGTSEDQRYWPRVWAVRGLLWATPGDRVESLRSALGDEHWRVREMACKVIARHRVEEVLDGLEDARADTVARVRIAAERALRRILESD